jgi:chromosomal replication initiation ATPase DnaA
LSKPIHQDPYFPWLHLGLRANPFQSLNPEDWVEIAHLPSRLSLWLEEPTPVLQISGPKGAGKTSVLYALKNELSRMGSNPIYVYIPPIRATPKLVFDQRILLVDEAQRLPRRSRFRLYRNAVALIQETTQNPQFILSTHEDLSGEFSRFSLEFNTIDLTAPGEIDLAIMLEKRVQYFAIGADSPVRFEPDAVRYLANKFGADLRSMESFLYAYFQSIPDQALITVGALKREIRD